MARQIATALAEMVATLLAVGRLAGLMVVGHITQVSANPGDVADFKRNIARWVWIVAAVVTGGTLAGLLGQSESRRPAGS